jgi:hypothetical protein
MLYSKNAKGEDVREFIIKPADPEIETFLPVGVYASNNKVIYKKQITKSSSFLPIRSKF